MMTNSYSDIKSAECQPMPANAVYFYYMKYHSRDQSCVP